MNDTIVTLNKFPPEKYNVLIPVATMQAISNLQKIIINEVRLDTTTDENGSGSDIYRERSTGKFAITKVGGMKLAAAANISLVDSQVGTTEICKRCVQMASAVGKPQQCGQCPKAWDLSVTVTIRVPEPSGSFRMIRATKELYCDEEKGKMSQKQYERFLPHRQSIAESKAFMRAIRSALGLQATYTISELKKPFVIAHIVPNLDAPEIKSAITSNYLQSMGLLFEMPERHAIQAPAATEAAGTTVEEIVDTATDDVIVAESGSVKESDCAGQEPEGGSREIHCSECGDIIKAHGFFTPEKIREFSERKYGRCLCLDCQEEEKERRRHGNS